ncbi:hypothetical protein Dimus_010723 [Dionaea muscipula]
MERLATDSGVNKKWQTRKRRQKQVARTGPAVKRAKIGKGNVSSMELGTEPRKEQVMFSSSTVEELDQQVDELLTRPFISEAVHEGEIDRVDKDQEGQKDGEEVVVMDEKDDDEGKEKGDVGLSASERRYRRRSLSSPRRLRVPSGRMGRSCMGSMMGDANHATIRGLHNVHLKHKCAILWRNMAETSLLTGDVLYNAIRNDDRRCRNIDRLMEEKYAMEREVKELKFTCDSTFEVSKQMKTDVDMVIEENQALENKNEELKTALKDEKDKAKTLEDKVKELQTTLWKGKERQSKKNDDLVASYSKYHELLWRKMNLDTFLNERKRESEKLQMALAQMKEKRIIVEECVPKQLDFCRKEAVMEFLSSEECSSKFNDASGSVLHIGFKIGIAQVRRMDDDELIPELEKMELNPKVKCDKELIPPIECEPSVWFEAYEADPMKFIKEWGIKADVSIDISKPVKVVRLTPITASQAPSTFQSDVPPQDRTTHPSPLSEQNIPPPQPNISGESVL